MTFDISIIIPVYNAETFIGQCIESLLQQSLTTCEFIFINDGSTDKSISIIKSYQKKDSRIKIYTQQNQGVSIARNKGLDLAIGKYIGFIDADDVVEKDFYQNLFQEAEKFEADIVFSNYLINFVENSKISNSVFKNNQLLNKEYINQIVIPSFLKTNRYNSVCTKLYRNSLIQECNIQFPEKVPLGEDGQFNVEYLCVANSMIYISYAGYYYREVQGSATRNFANRDYFQSSIQDYDMNYPKTIYSVLNADDIVEYKSIKLIQGVYALLYIYFTPNKKINLKSRFKNVNYMINHGSVQKSLQAFKKERQDSWGIYEKYIFYMIKYKSIIGLYFLTLYSRFRNKEWR